MRYIHRHILLVLLSVLCFWPSAAAAPQSDNYDKALDKYAYICDRCVEMRAKVESGQSIKMESLGSLMAELSSLRKTLSNASGKMSAAQEARRGNQGEVYARDDGFREEAGQTEVHFDPEDKPCH